MSDSILVSGDRRDGRASTARGEKSEMTGPDPEVPAHTPEQPPLLPSALADRHDPDWRERIEHTKQVRRETLEARKTRKSTLDVIPRAPLQALGDGRVWAPQWARHPRDKTG